MTTEKPNNFAHEESEDLITRLSEIIDKYKEEIRKIGFALPEAQFLYSKNKDTESLLHTIAFIAECNIDLNRIFDACPDSIYVVDGQGVTVRVNKSFEQVTSINRKEVMGRTVYELEKEGYFRPSVNGLALKEQRPVSILQTGKSGSKVVVTGVPIKDKNGHIYRSVSNAKMIEEIKSIMEYVDSARKVHTEFNHSAFDFICESPSMKQIKALVDSIINTDSIILIQGETGVGKGVLANYIHNYSNRKEQRLVEINCGAIPEALLESELFGYESGAFTGADRRGKPGLIELADNGTILFDEISELPMHLQVKLLQYLQKRVISRVGGTKEIHVNARIIAATNKDLYQAVQTGKFRADLYYRLNVIPINIPALRERPEDIKQAINVFIKKYNSKYGKNISLDSSYSKKLVSVNWPGNLRELENYIERVVVTSPSNAELDIKSYHSFLPECHLIESREEYAQGVPTDRKSVV